jgi:hypothetical protein
MKRSLLLLLVFSTAGCRIILNSDDTGGGTADALSSECQDATTHSDLAWIQDNVFTKACAFSGCHKGTASSAGFLNLESGMSHANLVAQPTQSVTGFMRVVAGSDSTSYLMVAIHDPSASGPEPQHGYMPQGNPELCQEKKDAIGRWITMGAMP